jgi:transcriptional regulator with XRE-family HTH domain
MGKYFSKIRFLRELHALRQIDLARLSGVSVSTIWLLENGSPIREKTASKIAKALGVSSKELS